MVEGLYGSRFVAASRRSHADGRGTRCRNCGSGALSNRQPSPAPAQSSQAGRERPEPTTDPNRGRELYVSNDPADHSRGYDFARDIEAKAAADERYAKASQGVMDFKKVSYRSSVGDMDIPAYLFQPLKKRGPKGHAAMVWVHGGVHGNWGVGMFPFVKEAVERGYVVICPEYRGSTGYGEAHHNAIDYGGYEIDDTMSAVDYLRTLPHVDQDRLGIMGWSHGGYITLLSVFREKHPFKAAAAMVPVTNLVFRLSYKGPGYQRQFSTQSRIRGLPFEKRSLYIERSPLYHVDKLQVPLLVHVATNDTDVDFVEDQQIVDALRSRKPDLAETKVYVDPVPGPASGGHTFNRRVNPKTLERDDSPDQRDSWNRTWTFFEWQLRPYEDRSLQKQHVPHATAKPSPRTPGQLRFLALRATVALRGEGSHSGRCAVTTFARAQLRPLLPAEELHGQREAHDQPGREGAELRRHLSETRALQHVRAQGVDERGQRQRLMNGCTTSGKRCAEKNTPERIHIGSWTRFIRPDTASIVRALDAISSPRALNDNDPSTQRITRSTKRTAHRHAERQRAKPTGPPPRRRG